MRSVRPVHRFRAGPGFLDAVGESQLLSGARLPARWLRLRLCRDARLRLDDRGLVSDSGRWRLFSGFPLNGRALSWFRRPSDADRAVVCGFVFRHIRSRLVVRGGQWGSRAGLAAAGPRGFCCRRRAAGLLSSGGVRGWFGFGAGARSGRAFVIRHVSARLPWCGLMPAGSGWCAAVRLPRAYASTGSCVRAGRSATRCSARRSCLPEAASRVIAFALRTACMRSGDTRPRRRRGAGPARRVLEDGWSIRRMPSALPARRCAFGPDAARPRWAAVPRTRGTRSWSVGLAVA